VILLASQGLSAREIAGRLKTRLARVSKWRQRFCPSRWAGGEDAARPGRPKTYDQKTEKRILGFDDAEPPDGDSRWNGRLLAVGTGRHQRRSSMAGVAEAQDSTPATAKLVHFDGSRVRPPRLPTESVCIGVHRTTLWCCAWTRKLIFRFGGRAPGMASAWQSAERIPPLLPAVRHQRVTAPARCRAALEVATGQVQIGRYPGRRRREFLDFLNI
jgi:hypothetical protein